MAGIMWEISWTWNFLARQGNQPSSEHGSYWNKPSPWLLSCYRMWHGVETVGSSVFPESQVYWAQGAEQAQEQITCSLVTGARSRRAFPKQLVATAACPAVVSLKRGHRPENLVWFVNLLPAAVFLCLHCLLGGGSWGLGRGIPGSKLQGRQVV